MSSSTYLYRCGHWWPGGLTGEQPCLGGEFSERQTAGAEGTMLLLLLKEQTEPRHWDGSRQAARQAELP